MSQALDYGCERGSSRAIQAMRFSSVIGRLCKRSRRTMGSANRCWNKPRTKLSLVREQQPAWKRRDHSLQDRARLRPLYCRFQCGRAVPSIQQAGSPFPARRRERNQRSGETVRLRRCSRQSAPRPTDFLQRRGVRELAKQGLASNDDEFPGPSNGGRRANEVLKLRALHCGAAI